MEAAEENGGNMSMKRQRAPLSDSEDNVLSASEMNDTQKRRRLEAAGQENRKPSSSVRHVEQQTKPNTPVVPSVQSGVQQLTQRRDGGAPLKQQCLSDPRADSPSVILHEKGFRENLLGEGEFHQRLERFKVPVFQASPAPTPSQTSSCPRPCSNVVLGIHQKLQGATTPSSKRASRMRQEREQELNQLHFQPISENAWLKRSSSDPSLSQADGDPVVKDGSFTETLTSGTEKQPSDGTGERAPCDSETPAVPIEPENSNEGQLQMEGKEQNAHQSEEVRKEEEHRVSDGHEEKQLGSKQTQSQSVLKLSFSEDQGFSTAPVADVQNVSELPTDTNESLLESTHIVELDITETYGVSKVTEQSMTEVFSFDGGEEVDSYSYSEEGIEPSTDEELRLWRYPQDKVCKEQESTIAEQDEDVLTKEEEEDMDSSSSSVSNTQDGQCYLDNDSDEIAGWSEMLDDKEPGPEEDELQSESSSNDSVKDQSTVSRNQGNIESCEGCYEGALIGDIDSVTLKQDQKDKEECSHKDDTSQQSREIQTVDIKENDMDLESDRKGPNSRVKQTEGSPFADVAQAKKEQMEYTQFETNIEDVSKPKVQTEAKSASSDGAQCLVEVQLSDHPVEPDKIDQDAVDDMQGVREELREDTHKAEGGESSKKVTFILEPKLINDSTLEARAETGMSDAELSSHDETNTAEIIDQMFEEVLEYAGRIEEERVEDEDTEDHDSGIGACVDKDKMDTESEKEKSEEEGEAKEGVCDESKKLDYNGDELLTFPPSGILSPLSKSVEAMITPLRLAVSQESNPPSLLLTPEEMSTPPAESAPLYSIDAYRTQRQSKQPSIQSVTPGVQRQAVEKSQPQPSVNTKEKITALTEEAGKLQNVINQTLQALSCCTDEEHGRGSLEEAEAEKLLLVSCEKRSALLAEVARLREDRNSESGDTSAEGGGYVSQQPCRGTVSITNIQLPLKVEFVCSSHNRTGRPSHYFFVLIRYGPCNIVATPLATATDAQNGDTISFSTSVTLKDIRSSFEIDVEVYSLSHTSVSNCSMDRTTTKSRVTPRKLLNTITRSSHTLTSALPALNTPRSSNFCLVGSHKITLASLGHSKFPLDKMKLEGKIRRLLGDEFQEKVPFLSPLEGNIYLRLDSQSHSNVQHQGFLTMFELISGYGLWHRRYFILHGCNMYYWNHPNDKETKEAEGSISLSSSSSQSVRPVKRDSCARLFTFELVSNLQQQDDSQEALAKCWFSADTKQERLDWMEKLNQALLDFHTWNRSSTTRTESHQSNTSSSGNLRESIL